jgi:hypothetical protein
MAEIVGEAFRHPQTARTHRLREIPGAQFERTQSFHVPNMEELMRDCTQGVVVHTGICERATLDDLGGGQVFHAIAGMIVGGKVNQKGVLLKFRSSPQRRFRSHNLFDVPHQTGTLAAFLTKRVDHHVIFLAVDHEIVLGPIRRDFGWRIDHDVPIGKLPFVLAGTLDAPIHNLPTLRWIDHQFHWIWFVADHVHEDAAAVVVGVTVIELRKRA